MHGRIRTWGPGLLVLTPTIALIGYFVYGLIGATFNTSLTAQHTARKQDYPYVGLENYTNLFHEERFINSLKNLGVLTIMFIIGTMFFGVLWAMLLGWLRFGEHVSLFTLLGACLIVAGCLAAARTRKVDHPALEATA